MWFSYKLLWCQIVNSLYQLNTGGRIELFFQSFVENKLFLKTNVQMSFRSKFERLEVLKRDCLEFHDISKYNLFFFFSKLHVSPLEAIMFKLSRITIGTILPQYLTQLHIQDSKSIPLVKLEHLHVNCPTHLVV